MMNNNAEFAAPPEVALITEATRVHGFAMASDAQTGSLLRSLAASKPGGAFLELGTGTGLAAAWILSGMDATATLTSVDNDPAAQAIAREYLGRDARATFHLGDGAAFLTSVRGHSFDFVFADTWAGKYTHLAETLALLAPGGWYIVDDMLPQPGWPDGHAAKADALLAILAGRDDLWQTRLNWSTGLVVCVKRG